MRISVHASASRACSAACSKRRKASRHRSLAAPDESREHAPQREPTEHAEPSEARGNCEGPGTRDLLSRSTNTASLAPLRPQSHSKPPRRQATHSSAVTRLARSHPIGAKQGPGRQESRRSSRRRGRGQHVGRAFRLDEQRDRARAEEVHVCRQQATSCGWIRNQEEGKRSRPAHDASVVPRFFESRAESEPCS